ncbi:hypothetical protein A3A66_04495 [Microgenomates group bacterium RIFCSPLOWO2_01_FULL_46_13]|nr:MAG: hypothetical protein A2783_04955 [Microgenomates group bacterium RIFCSPHIGHO2_01_FULL_45_11]OGV94229.1 MAG: hypothetical protein A3A66_04495 [Microgenomates group bacterium RIFCSPLOWO2_01_FULL_46_13]
MNTNFPSKLSPWPVSGPESEEMPLDGRAAVFDLPDLMEILLEVNREGIPLAETNLGLIFTLSLYREQLSSAKPS